MQPRIDDPKMGRARPTRAVVRVGALLAVIVVGALWFNRDFAPETPPDGSQPIDVPVPTETDSGTVVPDTRRALNRTGGYRFRYPRRWKVRREDEVTVITAPGSHTTVNLGPAVRRPARRLAASLFDVIDALPTYRRVRRTGAETRAFAGGDAHLISGTAVNEDGVRLRILVVGLDRGRRTFPVTIFTAADTNPERVLPRVEAIASSVQPLRRG